MEKVLITGGTGLIGKYLCGILIEKGYEVAILSRQSSKNNTNGIQSYSWDIDKNEIDLEAINSCDHIIHLAGVNIGEKRWTTQRKQQIIESRTKSAEIIFRNIDKQEHKLKTFISSSAIGYYGAITSDTIFNETALSAEDFLGTTCNLWEQSADKFGDIGLRVVKIRTGIVLSEKGGALSKFSLPAKLGVGSAIGNGKQYLPWIHIEDLCRIYLSAIENVEISGSYNAVAPEHITNKEFARKVSNTLKKPFWIPNIPTLLIRLLFGEMSAMLLHGSRVSSEKIESSGYKFSFPALDTALQDLYK
ncbi:MAG: TIGR01777 family oxidoreductase [Bacteroidales bacterium]|jgi:uncharacterized protein (TIGR01777 family)|nr:TIGR01777 family oxidoreductase [Bacteroidales bacterium]